MKWDKVRIGDLCNITHGYAFKSKFFSDSGEYILLTPGNFKVDGGLKLKDNKEKYYVGDIPDKFICEEGDLLIVMTDLIQNAPILGGSAFIPESDKFLHNQRLGKVTEIDKSRIDIDYLYYIFNYEGYRAQVRASATGATVRHTAPDRIRNCTVDVPPLPTQKRIVSILSAYDDLIENNLKRIKLLEEAAQNIYREWFVEMRFPGWEKSKVNAKDGDLPEGWQKFTLGDILELNYGKALRKDGRVENGEYPVYGSAGVVGYHDQYLVKAPGLILGRKGNVGSTFFSQKDFHPIDTVYYVSSSHSLLYLFHVLKNETFVNTDAAVPGLNRNYALSKPVILPSNDILSNFDSLTSIIYQQIEVLENQMTILKEARDILLPRLMNRTIEV